MSEFLTPREMAGRNCIGCGKWEEHRQPDGTFRTLGFTCELCRHALSWARRREARLLQGIPWPWLRSELVQDAAYRVEVVERLRQGRFPNPPSYHPAYSMFAQAVEFFQGPLASPPGDLLP